MMLLEWIKARKGTAGKDKGESMQAERRNLLSAQSDFFVREAYKTLRTNVSFSLADKEGCPTIMVTSAFQNEGKSITALNLAISYAMADRRVLLIDCDLRRPKVARLLNERADAGLSNLIMDPKLRSEAVHPTKIKGLDVIFAGNIPPNPSELLGSYRMERILQDMRKEYDMIVLDSPPVNVVTDAVVLAPQSDGVLFLVRANYSERGAVIHAVEQLEYAKAKILGFVLNDVETEANLFGYGKYRGKYYGRYGRYGRYGYSKYGYSKYGYSSLPQEQESGKEETVAKS